MNRIRITARLLRPIFTHTLKALLLVARPSSQRHGVRPDDHSADSQVVINV